jgi:uncharacterized hydrophobic protein (TIGR00271 family)
MGRDEQGTNGRGVGVDGAPVPTDAPRRTPLPQRAQRVLVPVANPASAPELLALAAAFCQLGGKVIALTVALDDAPTHVNRDSHARLAGIVELLSAETQHRTIELLARPAPSIARGILEVARESRADLIVLGIPVAEGDGALLGPVADAIIGLAPCDVVLVRPGLGDEHVWDATRVVVAVDGDDASRTAVRAGVVLAGGLQLPVQAVHVQDSGRPVWDGYAVLARSLDEVTGGEVCRRKLLHGANVADAMIADGESTDLLLVGLHSEGALQRWLFGSVSSDLLRHATGPVLVVARKVGAAGDALTWRDRAASWLRPRLTDVEQETLLWAARRDATTTIDYLTLLVISAVLATLGLVQDSVAVIIGAMLVAPLLGPLAAIAIGLVTARTPLLRRGLSTLFLGTGAAMLVSLLVGWLLPLTTPTSQMLLRGSPTLLDVGVAMASGLVGAYAIARKDIPAALAGVAIAAALIPPLCTVGLGLALGQPALAGGALLLFLVNISAVIVTGSAGFLWFGMHPVAQDRATRRRIVSAVVAAALVLLVVTAAVGLLDASRKTQAAAQNVRVELDVGDGVEVVRVEVDANASPIAVLATVRSSRDITPSELAEIEDRLAETLGGPVALRVIVQRVLTPER